MKNIILIRHADAKPAGDGGDDFNRRLTEIGHKEAAGIAAKLADVNIKADIIISSPATRALETAGHIAGAIGYPKANIVQNRRIYQNPAPPDFFTLLDEFDDDIAVAFLVGHNPSLSDFGQYLCPRFHEKMQKASAVGFAFKNDDWVSLIPGRGKLLFYLTLN